MQDAQLKAKSGELLFCCRRSKFLPAPSALSVIALLLLLHRKRY
jgi:hypothetical protein